MSQIIYVEYVILNIEQAPPSKTLKLAVAFPEGASPFLPTHL